MSVEGWILPFNEILVVPRVPVAVRMDEESRLRWTGGWPWIQMEVVPRGKGAIVLRHLRHLRFAKRKRRISSRRCWDVLPCRVNFLGEPNLKEPRTCLSDHVDHCLASFGWDRKDTIRNPPAERPQLVNNVMWHYTKGVDAVKHRTELMLSSIDAS